MNGVGKSFCLLDEGKVIGYISRNESIVNEEMWLDEACATRLDESRLWATVRSMASSMGAKHVRGWLVPTYKLLSMYRSFEAAPRQRTIPMIAVLDPSLVIDDASLERAYFPSPDHF